MGEVQITATDGVGLQARVVEPPGQAVGTAIICHPHPAFGGHMDVWLLPRIADALLAVGWASVRFNFRGVEGSGGRQTAGAEEHLDAEGALAHARVVAPGVPTIAVGWSFGAMIALRLGTSVDAWIGIAPPTRELPDLAMAGPVIPDVLPGRRTVIVGEHDQFFPPSTVDVLGPEVTVVLPDADHFLFDRDPEVADAVVDAAGRMTA